MKLRSSALLGAALVAMMAATSPAGAGSLDVYVGYADGLRGSPNFPNPWCGSVTIEDGNCTAGYTSWDTGAVLLVNNTGGDLTLTSLTVDVGGTTFDIWDSVIGLGQVLHVGNDVALFENSGNNFDSSDVPITCTPTGVIPVVHVGIGGSITDYSDTGQILNTGGIDPPTCTGANEALGWRLIGTTDFNNPGNQFGVPEPISLSLFGAGLAGVVAMRRRRQKTA